MECNPSLVDIGISRAVTILYEYWKFSLQCSCTIGEADGPSVPATIRCQGPMDAEGEGHSGDLESDCYRLD